MDWKTMLSYISGSVNEDLLLGPFRSSSPRGEPQIWGVSEAETR